MFHDPLIIIAALPPTNWSATSFWFQVTTDFDAEPEFTRSVTYCRACVDCDESNWDSSAPLLQKNGRNCQVPSSDGIAEKARPYLPPLVSFAAAAFSSSQVFGGSTPAACRRSLL